MARIDEEISRLERRVRGGDATPEALLRLGQVYLRADRAQAAQEVLAQAQERISAGSAVVWDAAGEVAGLHPLWDEVRETLQQAQTRVEERLRASRRAALLELVEAGRATRAQHDELIRLEVADGEPLHPELPACPACAGPVLRGADGQVRCARSGKNGDLCRHIDATGLYACPSCGLVVRRWNARQLRPDPHEPPLVRPDRARCGFCGGGVVDWAKHFLHCPKARPGDFPRCSACSGRGFHRRALTCPRCRARVGDVACAEPKAR